MNNFDLIKFLAEGKLTANSKALNEDKLPTIKISKDIYYFDKLDRLDTKDNVDEKYHNRADLIFKKGQTIKDDTKYEDSDYKMITSSTSLEKGIDYSDDGKAAGGMNESPANEAMNSYGGGNKGAEEFIAAAENGVGIADYLKGLFANYNKFYGDALEDEGIFYEFTSEDKAILRAIGRSDLLG